MEDSVDIIFIAILTFIAAAIGTMAGFGTSTLLVPILVLLIPPVEAIFLVAIIHWFGNVWKVTLFRSGFNLKLLLLFGITGLLTSYLGASITLGTNEALLVRLLGLFLALYALFLLFEPSFKIAPRNFVALIGGALSGFFAGMFGIGGAIRSAFLSVFNLPKAVYIATAGAIGLIVDSTRIITYLTEGATLPGKLWYSLLLLIPVSFLGAQLAKHIVDQIPQKKFRIVVAGLLCLVGLRLLLW